MTTFDGPSNPRTPDEGARGGFWIPKLSWFTGLSAPKQVESAFDVPVSRVYPNGPLLLKPPFEHVREILSRDFALRFDRFDVLTTPTRIETSVEGMVHKIEGLSFEEREVVATDISRTARTLLRFCDPLELAIAIEPVVPRGTSRVAAYPLAGFHVDKTSVRLARSYLGPGTEFLPPGAIDRDVFESCLRSGRELPFASVDSIEGIDEGAIVIFEGSTFVHRRPFWAGPRVFLTVDALGGKLSIEHRDC